MTDKAWITMTVEPYELVALVDWHLEQKRVCAIDERFEQAEVHRKRALELMKLREAAGETRRIAAEAAKKDPP
jgi:hypothetical protein